MPILDFPSKDLIYGHHLTVPYRTIKAHKGKSVSNGDLDNNLIIHGDNLDTLKALMPRYSGKVNCIYMDPPYNTGNEGWVYNDNVNSPTMQKWLKDKTPVDGEDTERHDKWLCMMLPRLQLMKELLAQNGVIFISIDDNEQAHLKLLMGEIFGEENFVATIIWEKKYSRQNDARYFSRQHDFIVCFAKDKESWKPMLLPRDEEKDATRYKNPDNDPRGPWTRDNLSVSTYSAEYDYPITTPAGKVVHPPKGSSWRYPKKKYEEMVADNRIWFGSDGNSNPSPKRFLSEVQQGLVPQSIFYNNDAGDTGSARKEIRQFFGDTGVSKPPSPPV